MIAFGAVQDHRDVGLRSMGAVSKAVQSYQVPEGLVRAGFPLGRPRVVSYKGGFFSETQSSLVPNTLYLKEVTPFPRHGKLVRSFSALIQLRLSPFQ